MSTQQAYHLLEYSSTHYISFHTKMSEVPQESLRRHRQTLLPPKKDQSQKGLQSQQPNARKKPHYGALLSPGSGDLPSVQQKDKEKVCSFSLSI